MMLSAFQAYALRVLDGQEPCLPELVDGMVQQIGVLREMGLINDPLGKRIRLTEAGRKALFDAEFA